MDAGSALFTYGSLMFESVWTPLVARPRAHMRARLPGYRRERVTGAPYPGICADASGSTAGRVYFGLDDEDLSRLDRFEGDRYRRIAVEVLIDGVPDAPVRLMAQTYLLIDPSELSGEPWDPETFSRDSAQGFFEAHWPGPQAKG